MPLKKLADSMFPVHPADPVNLTWMAEFLVPPIRAAWFIRVHYTHRRANIFYEPSKVNREHSMAADMLRRELFVI